MKVAGMKAAEEDVTAAATKKLGYKAIINVDRAPVYYTQQAVR